MTEKPLIGWKAIADFLGWTFSKAKSKRQQLKEARIIFPTLTGRPPNRKRVIIVYPSLLIDWLSLNFPETGSMMQGLITIDRFNFEGE